MALYEYFCAHCGDVVEVNHSIFDEPEILCEACKSPRSKKPTVGAVTFRGGGWGHSA